MARKPKATSNDGMQKALQDVRAGPFAAALAAVARTAADLGRNHDPDGRATSGNGTSASHSNWPVPWFSCGLRNRLKLVSEGPSD